jgi:P pilus assembly chaperone PapD
VPPRGRNGTASGYSLRTVRTAERDLAAQDETAYRTMVAAWPSKPITPTRASRARAAESAVCVATRREVVGWIWVVRLRRGSRSRERGRGA